MPESNEHHSIPPENLEAVTRALRSTFGVDQCEAIRDLTERPGSNRAFRVVVKGSPFLLRINTRQGDVDRQFDCMRAAAAINLAPRVHYVNVDDRVSITDFVESVPLPASDALRLVPEALRRLHAVPAAFPVVPFNTTCTFLLTKSAMLDGFVQNFQKANVLGNDTAGLLARYSRVAEAYAALEPDPVASHNDLFKPDNMIYDGRRLWLVDWEAAFQNDRYADLAVVANMLAADEAAEQTFLREYFGAPPTPYQSARLYLMRQLAHMFYAMAFLSMAAIASPVDWSKPVPTYDDYMRQFWSHEVNLNDNDSKLLFGRVHWHRLQEEWKTPQFEESLNALVARSAAS